MIVTIENIHILYLLDVFIYLDYVIVTCNYRRVVYGPQFQDFVPNSGFLLKTYQFCPEIQDYFGPQRIKLKIVA